MLEEQEESCVAGAKWREREREEGREEMGQVRRLVFWTKGVWSPEGLWA